MPSGDKGVDSAACYHLNHFNQQQEQKSQAS